MGDFFSLNVTKFSTLVWLLSNRGVSNFSVYFWRARVATPLLISPTYFFVFLRDVWIRTQRAVVASRRATINLATHLPNLANHFTNLATHLHYNRLCNVYISHIGVMHSVL